VEVSKSVSSNITAKLNEKGELIDIEIFIANTFIWDSILESVQVKMLQYSKVQAT
jgi:uncharacterized protein YuzE